MLFLTEVDGPASRVPFRVLAGFARLASALTAIGALAELLLPPY